MQCRPSVHAPLLLPHVNLPPQPSSMVPQSRVPQVFLVQLSHTFETQRKSVPHAPLFGPHVSLPPQLSDSVPQLAFLASQVVGMQGTHLLLVQTRPVAHPVPPLVPQLYFTPALQGSLTCPHSAPAAVHAGFTGTAHVPQLKTPPQPSETVPQVPVGKSVHFFFAQTPQVNATASQT